jgi:hypothetical protein
VDEPKSSDGERAPPEIEIIPPDRAPPFRQRGRARLFVSFGGRGGAAAPPLSLAMVLAGAMFVVLVSLVAVAVIGTLLIWIPLALLFVVLALAGNLLRGYFRRPR